jgi:hypothetical protein
MPRYEVPDDHWESNEDENPPAWKVDTTADIEIDVTLHQQGYQNSRKWTVHVNHSAIDTISDAEDERVVAGFGVEHRNKGNYWRQGDMWDNAVDFVDLPLRVRRRVAAVLNRPLSEITPNERVIRREDGTGIADRDEHGGTDQHGDRDQQEADR